MSNEQQRGPWPASPPAGDQINAQEAQGFINRPGGPVEQYFDADKVGRDKNVFNLTVNPLPPGLAAKAASLDAASLVSSLAPLIAGQLESARAALAAAGQGPSSPPPAAPSIMLDHKQILGGLDLSSSADSFSARLNETPPEGVVSFAVACEVVVARNNLVPRLIQALNRRRGRQPAFGIPVVLRNEDLEQAATHLEIIEKQLDQEGAARLDDLVAAERIDRILLIENRDIPLPNFAAFAARFMSDAVTRLAPLVKQNQNLLVIIWAYAIGHFAGAEGIYCLPAALEMDRYFDAEGYLADCLRKAAVAQADIDRAVARLQRTVRVERYNYALICDDVKRILDDIQNRPAHP
jgi:hypothetical protein